MKMETDLAAWELSKVIMFLKSRLTLICFDDLFSRWITPLPPLVVITQLWINQAKMEPTITGPIVQRYIVNSGKNKVLARIL